MGYTRIKTFYRSLLNLQKGLHSLTLVNFFFPSMKIISKKRIDAKVIKKYDTAKTPYCRLMESSDVSEAVKAELCRRKNNLDLQQLLETTQYLQRKLISMAQPWS